MTEVGLFIKTLGVLLVIDAVWLGFVARQMYQSAIGHLMAKQVNWLAAVVFYLLYAAGLVFLVLLPAQKMHVLPLNVFVTGFVFGLVAYGTYDLTNLTTLKEWPLYLTIIDMLWGALLTGVTSYLVYTFFK